MSVSDIPSRANSPTAPRDGGALRERVQSLRLDVETGGGPSLWKLLVLGMLATIVAGGGYLVFSAFRRAAAKNAAGGKVGEAGVSANSSTERKQEIPPISASQGKNSESTPADSAKGSAVNPNATTRPEAPARAAIGGAGSPVLESKGYLLPVHRVLVSPKVSGMLTKVNIEEGMRVAKGDVLAVIEKIEYQHDVDRLTAIVESNKQRWQELQSSRQEEINSAKADLEEAKAKLAEYEADYKRTKDLFQRKVVQREQLDAEKANYETQLKRIDRFEQQYQMVARGPREEQREAAAAQVRQAEADLAKAQWRLDNCEVVAPSGGTVLRKNAEEGNLVNPLAQQGSFSLCDLADLSDLEVDLDVQERDVSRVFVGQRCTIATIAWPTRIYDGWVSRLMPIADRGKGAVPVRVKVQVPPEEEGVYLKPDMGAIVRFFGDTSPLYEVETQAMLSPRAALSPDEPAQE